MQNYDLPDANTGNTFNGVIFTFPGMDMIPRPNDEVSVNYTPHDTAELSISPGFGLEPVLSLNSENGGLSISSMPESAISINPFLINMPPGLYHWDLKITFTDGRVKTYIGGKWRINPIITI